jgi:hypothetical protein
MSAVEAQPVTVPRTSTAAGRTTPHRRIKSGIRCAQRTAATPYTTYRTIACPKLIVTLFHSQLFAGLNGAYGVPGIRNLVSSESPSPASNRA